jgi:hypothetical protein
LTLIDGEEEEERWFRNKNSLEVWFYFFIKVPGHAHANTNANAVGEAIFDSLLPTLLSRMIFLQLDYSGLDILLVVFFLLAPTREYGV